MFRPGPPRDERELPRRFRFGDVEVDVGAARARRGGAALPLEPKAFDLLLLLAANPDRVVEKAEIFERLWEQAFVGDNALTRVVALLRHELGDSAERPTVIETVRTRGYRFLPTIEAAETVEAIEEPAPDAPSPAPAGPALETFRSARRRAWPWAAVAAAAIVLATGAAWVARQRGRPQPAVAEPPRPVQLTNEPGNHFDPAFSPDGSQIVYVGDSAGGLELFVMPVGGGQTSRLTHSGGSAEPAWSPDGRWIVYSDLVRGGLWLISPNGAESRQLTDFGRQPAWSPDARTVVFSHPGTSAVVSFKWAASYDSTLWLVDVATGATRRLTEPVPGAGGHGSPEFTADGHWVVFAAASFSASNLWRVPAGGGAPQPLLPRSGTQRYESVYWNDPAPGLRNEDLYAVRRGMEGAVIERLRLGESARTEPLLAPAPDGTLGLAVSHDGRHLAFAVVDAAASIEEIEVGPDGAASGPPRLRAAPPVERVMHQLYSPDGRFLLYWKARGGSRGDLVVQDREGRELRVIPARLALLPAWASPTEVVLAPLQDSLRVDVLTGRQTPIAAPHFSQEVIAGVEGRALGLAPDLRGVAFTAPAGDARELFLWSYGDPAPHQLTHLGGAIDFPAFSGDGRWVVFQSYPRPDLANELWRIALDGGEPERILTGRGPSWEGTFATRGDLVAYAANRGGTWYLAVAGPHSPERLLDVPPETAGYVRGPTWSPDGGRIAYERAHYRSQIWTLDLQPPAGGD